MADPIANAIGTFATLKGMEYQGQQAERQKRLDEERIEDRIYQRKLLDKQEARADEQFEFNKQTAQENSEWTSLERERKVGDWKDADVAKAREQADQILLEFTGQMKAAGKEEWGKEEVGVLMERLEPVKHGLRAKLSALYDPHKVQERRVATESILKQLYTGEFDRKDLVKNANLAFADELDGRGQKYGANQVRFSRLVPSPQGDGFMAELEITKQDGSTYRAPATVNGGTEDDGDHEVKNFKMEEVAPYLVGQLLTLQGAESYLKARGKIKEKERKLKEGGSDKSGRYLYDESTGEIVRRMHGPIGDGQNGGGSGGTGGGGLKSHVYTEFNSALLRSMIADYGIDDGDYATDDMGNQKVDINRYLNKLPTEAKQRYLQALNKGEQLMVDGLSPIQAAQQALGGIERQAPVDPKILAKAEEIATKEAQKKAGWFSTDGSDFKDAGGTREGYIAERTQYWAQKLSGKKGESGSGTVYSRLAGGDQAETSANKVIKALAVIPDQAARQEQVQRFLQSDAPEDVKEQVRYQYEAQLSRSKAGEGRQQREAQYMRKESARMTPQKVKAQMFTNMNETLQKRGYDQDWQIKLLGKGLAALWKVSPTYLAGKEIAQGMKDFKTWAENRYKRPDAAEDPQVLVAYAEVNPTGAQQIAQAAADAAKQQPKSSGMARQR